MRPTRLAIAPLVCTIALAVPALALTPDHRLGHEAVPVSESVTLEVDPAQKQFRGSVVIEIRIAAATDSFQLHALQRTLDRVAFSGAHGSIPVTTSRDTVHGILTIRGGRRLNAGRYTLAIDFANDFDTRADGLYRLEVGGDAYAFTQFEAKAARQAFPCWDEPEFKIPWQITLLVPRGDLALSNTPIARETPEGDRRRVVFERTPPLPSYLIAIASGPLETVPIEGMGVPGRVVTVKGHAAFASHAARLAPAVLGALEQYFGFGYPFRKLDLIAVPEFWAGAMENPGAITFREEALLLDPTGASADQRRRVLVYLAHEMAHMWFGDYVTMKWWDDLWLSESFASWMGDKITQRVAPEFDVAVTGLDAVERAMASDARPSTRAMRQPVDAFDNLDRLADELAYDKGQAVLGMVEQWIGPHAFREGVKSYLQSHAWGNASGEDLWEALSDAAGFDVSGVVGSFLNQPGVPLVEVETAGATTVRLRQQRFWSTGEPGGAQRWRIPVTIRYSDGTGVRSQTVLLGDSAQIVRLGRGLPIAWVHPNADERGYYRWSVPPANFAVLADPARADLTPRERIGLLGDVMALMDAGRVSGDETLRLLARFANDPQPEVTSTALGALQQARVAFVTPELRDGFAAYVRRALGPVWTRIGSHPQPDESENVSLLRPRLMLWLGRFGRDERVLAEADARTRAALADPASADPALLGPALVLAATHGDASLFDAFREGFEKSHLPADRDRFLTALGSFGDTALAARALAYALTGALRPQELFGLLRAVLAEPENQDRVLAWMTANFDAIAARTPPWAMPSLTRALAGCSLARLEAGRAFFLEPAHRAPGTDVELAKVADEVRDCVRLREREGEAVARFLTTEAAGK